MAELPPIEAFICILQKCRKTRDLVHAKHVHALVCDTGLEAHQTVGNYIVPMFVECGSMLEADKAFNRSVHQNVHAWTSLISGYIQCGQPGHAFELYWKMQEGNVHPSSHTFVVLLKACTMLKDIKRGRQTHLESEEKGFEEDVFVSSTLIDMYSKCGLLLEAQEVFNNLPVRDVVLWNTLIAGYVEHDSSEEALMCFEQMKLGDCSPNVITFACSLKACGSLGTIYKGRELHTEIVQRFLERDLFVGNTLVDMYTKCDSLPEAQAVFDTLSIRDVVSWNALIAGYVEHGRCQEALKCFEQMQLEGVSPDAVTFVCILRACASLGVIDKGRGMDMEISRRKLKEDIFVGNTLVDMYAKCGLLLEARKAFDELPFHDVVSWNALIAGYAEHGPCEEALECFEQMQLDDVAQDAITYVCILKACGSIGAVEKGRRVHLEITQKGFQRHLFVGSTLVDMYAKCGSLLEAEDAFERLPVRDVMSWNALIAGYADQRSYQDVLLCLEQMQLEDISPNAVTFSCCLKVCGNQEAIVKGRELHKKVSQKGFEDDLFVGSALVDMYAECSLLVEARDVFDKLPVRDAASWNALIAGYADCGLDQEALELYKQMQAEGVSPNAVTFVCVLKACGSIGVIDKGQETHMEITHRGIKYSLYVSNTLLDMYAKCGSLSEAWDIFIKLPVQDVTSWNAIINGYGMNHDGNTAIQVFEEMQKQGTKPDVTTFTCLLTACSRSSLLFKGQEVFKVMGEEYGIVPSIDHYNCMVDLFARSGCLYEAQKFLQTMPCSPSKVLWTALLSACKTFVKAELGMRCFEELVHINPECATAYMLMADIYTSAGRWRTHVG